jgi:hypothetical protein
MSAGDALSSEFISGYSVEATRRPVSPAPGCTGRLLSGRMNLHCQGLRTGQKVQLKAAVRDPHDIAQRPSQWARHSAIVPLYDNGVCGLRRMFHVSRLLNDGRRNYTGARMGLNEPDCELKSRYAPCSKTAQLGPLPGERTTAGRDRGYSRRAANYQRGRSLSVDIG